MPRTRPPFPAEFRREAVKLMRESDKPLSQLAKDLGVSEQTLQTWRRQVEIDAGERDGLTSEQQEELRRLRRENRTRAAAAIAACAPVGPPSSGALDVMLRRRSASAFCRERPGRFRASGVSK